MTINIHEAQDKRDIALQYLTISGEKLRSAKGHEAYCEAMRGLKRFLELGRVYGLTDNEMRMALGFSRDRFQGVN